MRWTSIPRRVFARVRVPALMFDRADDAWTPVESSARAWRGARGYEVEVVVVGVPEASHELTLLPDDSIALEYERRLVDWLVQRTRSSR
jgi:hypothetical protein